MLIPSNDVNVVIFVTHCRMHRQSSTSTLQCRSEINPSVLKTPGTSLSVFINIVLSVYDGNGPLQQRSAMAKVLGLGLG